MDLALDNLQRLICHKTKPKQTTPKLKKKKLLLYIIYIFDLVFEHYGLMYLIRSYL